MILAALLAAQLFIVTPPTGPLYVEEKSDGYSAWHDDADAMYATGDGAWAVIDSYFPQFQTNRIAWSGFTDETTVDGAEVVINVRQEPLGTYGVDDMYCVVLIHSEQGRTIWLYPETEQNVPASGEWVALHYPIGESIKWGPDHFNAVMLIGVSGLLESAELHTRVIGIVEP